MLGGGWGEGGIEGPNPMQALGPEEGGAGHNGKVPPTQGRTPTVLGFITLYSPTLGCPLKHKMSHRELLMGDMLCLYVGDP